MPHPLKDYIAATGDTLTAFAARIGVSRRTLSRIIARERAPRPEIARRIVEATGGAVSMAALFGADESAVPDLAGRRLEESDVDVALLAQVLRHTLERVSEGRGRPPADALIEAAAEAVANTYAAMTAVTTRRGPDRLVQALRPVLEEILKDCPGLRLPRARLDEAARQASILYLEAKPRLQR